MRFRLRHAAALGPLIATAACSAILGDFTVGNGPPPVADGAADSPPRVDAPPVDANTPPDAGLDSGDAPPGLLACDAWRWPTPILVEDLSLAPTGRRFGTHLAVLPAQFGTVRIVVAKVATAPGVIPAFSVYTITKTTMQVQQLDGPTTSLNQSIVDIHHAASGTGGVGGTTAVAIKNAPDGGSVTSYDVVAFDDLMPATGPLPAAFPLYSLATGQSANSVSVLPFSTTDIFEAISTGAGSPMTFTLGVGRVSPTSAPSTLATVATSGSAAPFTTPRMFHKNGNVYVTIANDPSTPGCTGYTVPDTAVVPAPPPAQIISSGQDLVVTDLGANTTSAATNALMLQTNFSGQLVTGYKYDVGIVPDPSLSTWSSTSLGSLPGPASALVAPVGVLPAPVWFGDDIMMIGPGLRLAGDGGTMEPGLNLTWFNASLGIRSVQAGSTAILSDRTDFALAAALPGNVGLTPPNWDVVWVEDVTDADGGTHEVMRMNQLLCH